MDLAKEVCTNNSYEWKEGSLFENRINPIKNNKNIYKVIAYDYGVKSNILRLLSDLGCQLTVVPAETSVEDILNLKPSGIFLSNGPGDPEACDYAIDSVAKLLEKNIPIFGICLGYQLLALAAGAKTVKMKFGHHGANHPVIDVDTGKVIITSQNHGFAVDEYSLPKNIKITHKSLFDGSLQGIRIIDKDAFGFQGHPEASPGPHDLMYIFNEFINMIKNNSL